MASLSTKLQTYLGKCCLCQTEKKGEGLISPPPGSIEQDGYSMLATNIPLFKAINPLPIIIDTSRLDEGDGVEIRQSTTRVIDSCLITQSLRGRKKGKLALIAQQCFYLKKKNQSLNLEKL